MNTVAAALSFTSKGINHGHGILIGTAGDPGHEEIVLIDRWDPPAAGLINKNMTIPAPSGGDKTYAAIMMLLREWVQGVKVFILDPEKREYQQVCRYCEGDWLNAAGGRTLTAPQFLVITRVLRPLGRNFLPPIPAPIAAISHAASFHHLPPPRHEAGTTRKAQDIPEMQISVKKCIPSQ